MQQAPLRYEFFNFTDRPFTGRYGGVDFLFAPQEKRQFDADKHYQLLLMAKQLADRELSKNVAGVGRDSKDAETFGKSLDANGRPFVITNEARIEVMRKAIGVLVDIPVPVPADEKRATEAGETKRVSEDVEGLKSEIRELRELILQLAGNRTAPVQPVETQPRIGATKDDLASKDSEDEPNQSGAELNLSRKALEEMATDLGVVDASKKTKQELIDAINAAKSN